MCKLQHFGVQIQAFGFPSIELVAYDGAVQSERVGGMHPKLVGASGAGIKGDTGTVVLAFQYFKGTSNEKYVNPQKGFESYFIRFDCGADLELMSRTDVQNTPIGENRLGLTHFAFALDSKEEVLELTEKLQSAGYTISGEPRTSGDGYFESVVLDPDGNRVECVFKAD
jgi:lactoylglutathione lyase